MLSILIPCKNEPDIAEMVSETEKYLPGAEIIIATDREGRGKGWAIRKALEYAHGDLICFIDGDLDIHPSHILDLLKEIKFSDIVIGRKCLSGSLYRKSITFVSRIVIGILFDLWFDTQTGIKLFKRNCLPKWQNDSFAFDVEILYKAKMEGYIITEVPVSVRIRKNMPAKSILRFIRGLLQILFMK